MKLLRCLLLVLCPLALSGLPALAAAETALSIDPEVPFVPTPEEVVAEMLQMAEVDADDVVYDLGSGDGRIVITAAKERGARGVGVDINPVRIEESRQNAAQAGVTDRVEFLQSDLFEVDLRPASVVTLYLLPNVNLRLRPKLLRELAPGTRVVSHDFDMGEWQPLQTARLSGHSVYFWVVPANASGLWQSRQGNEAVRLELSQELQEVTGVISAGGQRQSISEGRVEGDRLRFLVPQGLDGRGQPARFEGKLQGDVLEGEIRPAGGPAGSWQLDREPDSRQEIDTHD